MFTYDNRVRKRGLNKQNESAEIDGRHTHAFVISSKEDFRGLPLRKDALKFNDQCSETENMNEW